MPGLNNRPEFQPGAGTFGSPNRQPLPPQFQPDAGFSRPQPEDFVSPLAQNLPTRVGAGPSTPQAPTPFCPTCGQRNQPSPPAGLIPNINTAGRQAPLAKKVSQVAGKHGGNFGGGRSIPILGR